MTGFVLLSTEQMRAAEAAAIENGVSSAALMEAAGKQTAQIVMKAWSMRPAVVLCGPGNNGGDGFVVARELTRAGWPIQLALMGDKGALKGDAQLMAKLYEGEILPLTPKVLEGAGLVIDALFGTGLSKPVEGEVRAIIEAVNAHAAPVLAVDLPSGISADTGAELGLAIRAARTVTFLCKKPGHVLFPGRGFSGATDIVDIGITGESVGGLKVDTFENHPGLWGRYFIRPSPMAHKYMRGSVFVVSGGSHRTGAARLAARGALRIGAGLVTVLSPSDAASENAAHLTAIMLKPADCDEDISNILQHADKYPTSVVIGPASGVGKTTQDKAAAILKSKASAVFDADALTSFEAQPSALLSALRPDDVLTPHLGEFERLFPNNDLAGGKLLAARRASKEAGAIVVLKGGDTVVAAPDGRAAINTNAPPDLATAGAGDVLAGFIAGLRAQGMPGFEAACAGVWLHGACAQIVGPGLIAEDLPEAVPAVLRSLLAPPERDAGNSQPEPGER